MLHVQRSCQLLPSSKAEIPHLVSRDTHRHPLHWLVIVAIWQFSHQSMKSKGATPPVSLHVFMMCLREFLGHSGHCSVEQLLRTHRKRHLDLQAVYSATASWQL
jgi:hypothetical protein